LKNTTNNKIDKAIDKSYGLVCDAIGELMDGHPTDDKYKLYKAVRKARNAFELYIKGRPLVLIDPKSINSPLTRLSADPFIWFQTMFQNHAKLESPDFHLDLVEAMLEHKYLAAAAPRGSAKSTILTFLKPFHDICFKKKRFILIVSNTFKKAAMSLDTIKKEIHENQDLAKWHGKLDVVKDAEGDSDIRHPDGFTTKVLCKGVDQLGSARGIKFGAHRPDLVLGDDLEDDELVRSPERRLQLQHDFDDVLTPIGDKDTQYVFIGTILHDDSLLARLLSKDHYLNITSFLPSSL